MWSLRGPFQTTIPREMEEAAIVDGCSDFRLFMQIVLPLSTPIIAVMALFTGRTLEQFLQRIDLSVR